ncbi:MAG: FAD-binding oxidoreductase [Archangiaceae bacterium]|nr:FAD-binding oxidoreductase [Archangiaceae bacterium]
MPHSDFLVIGAGIAGLSAAWHLARLGSVTLLEHEKWAFGHSSGRNAAMYVQLAPNPGDVQLALRSRPLLDEVAPRWRVSSGALHTAGSAAALERLQVLARSGAVRAERLDRAAIVELVPALAGGTEAGGLYCPDDGVIDVHHVGVSLAAAAKSRGAHLMFGLEAGSVLVENGRAAGVRLGSGESLRAGAVVLAGGAWAGGLGKEAGAPLPLVPLRRTLVVLDAPRAVAGRVPCWSADGGVYFRPESGAVLACPCDETEARPGEPAVDRAALELLAERLGRVAPALARASVRRAWAGLRTFAIADRAPAVGEDPRVKGLWWLAGLGGHGMTGGLAAGEVLAACVCGEADPLRATLAPARLISGARAGAP